MLHFWNLTGNICLFKTAKRLMNLFWQWIRTETFCCLVYSCRAAKDLETTVDLWFCVGYKTDITSPIVCVPVCVPVCVAVCVAVHSLPAGGCRWLPCWRCVFSVLTWLRLKHKTKKAWQLQIEWPSAERPLPNSPLCANSWVTSRLNASDLIHQDLWIIPEKLMELWKMP